MAKADHSLDTLLLLNGETFVVEGAFWVKFVVKQVPASSERPHGLDYSLTLHDGTISVFWGSTMVTLLLGTGPGARTRIEYDHKHKGKRARFYIYADAVTLLGDFWTEVDQI